jgi:RNA polymerase sigma-70 factor (ECF subfamily)
MSSSPDLMALLKLAYEQAYAFHGDLELNRESFINHLFAMIEKHHRTTSAEAVPVSLLKRLHTDDLYLTLACSLHNEGAWERLDYLYRDQINKLAHVVCRKRDLADELARSTLTHLFLADPAGHRRIASYQGLCSFIHWLAVVIHNRAIEEQNSFAHRFDQVDFTTEIEDASGLVKIERSLRNERYKIMVNQALRKACQALSDSERWFLTLKYEEGVRVKKIAEMAQLTSPTVTYHIQRAQAKLGKEICSVLKKDYHLNELALRECLEDVFENPAYSLLNFLSTE